MGIFDSLFGGEETTQQTTQTNKTMLSDEAQSQMDLANPLIKDFLKNPPQKADVVGFDPLQQQAQQGLVQMAGPGGALPQYASNQLEASNFLLNDARGPNPYLDAAIEAATRGVSNNFTRNVLPNIRSGAGVVGAQGSSRQGVAEGIASGDYLSQVGDISSSMSFEGYERGLTAAERALALAPQTAQQQTLPNQILDLVGATRRGQETEQQDVDFVNQYLPFLAAQEVIKTIAGTPGATYGESTVTAPGPTEPSTFQQILGGAATVAGIASGFPALGTALGSVGSMFG